MVVPSESWITLSGQPSQTGSLESRVGSGPISASAYVATTSRGCVARPLG